MRIVYVISLLDLRVEIRVSDSLDSDAHILLIRVSYSDAHILWIRVSDSDAHILWIRVSYTCSDTLFNAFNNVNGDKVTVAIDNYKISERILHYR